MIGWGDVYNVVAAMVPMYVALGLGYGSVRWWHVFTPDQCLAVDRFVTFFTLPLFTFEFISKTNPFKMNLRFIAGDAISKAIIILVLIVWVGCRGGKGPNYDWCITNFSLATLSNTLVVGVPLLRSMYGAMAQDLVVQAFVVQGIIWFTLLLFVLEFRKTRGDMMVAPSESEGEGQPPVTLPNDATDQGSSQATNDLESADQNVSNARSRPSFGSLMKAVMLKLACNPNSYASLVGLAWAAISKGSHFEMPVIMEDSILIISKAGAGTSMFSLGLFRALQKKMIACGPGLTIMGMLLRFVGGPAAMAISSFAVGLRGRVFRVAVIQAALPQAITCFIYARDYGLHAEVLSTAVIFGTLVSLPVLIGYYALMELSS